MIDNPKMFGKRLIPQIMDDLALSEPDRVVYSLASFSDEAVHLRTITAGAFAKAVDKTAWFLRDHLQGYSEGQGNSGSKNRVLPIGYIGPRKLGWQ